MITHFSNYKTSTQQPMMQPSTSQSQDKTKYGWLPTALGVLGAFGGPQFAMEGGRVGTMLDQELSGQNPLTNQNMQQAQSNAAEQGIYGAIPGGDLGGGMVTQALKRFIGGGIGGAGTQVVRNLQEGQPITRNIVGQGIATGGMNAVAPGVGRLLGVPTNTLGWLGKVAEEHGQNILENKATPALNAISRLFGTTAIGQEGGKSFVSPEVQNFIQEHKIPIPPQESWLGIKPAVLDAQKRIEASLEPLLSREQATIDNIQGILKENKDKFLTGDRAWQKNLPVSVKNLFNTNAKTIDLYTLKKAQRDLGELANWHSLDPKPIDKFAKQTYNDLGNLIESHLTRPENSIARALNNQHKIAINLKQNVKSLEGQNVLPEELSSQARAEAKAMSGLAGERLKGLAVHSVTPLLTAGAAFMGSKQDLPEPVKLALDAIALGAAGYGASEWLPYIAPEAGVRIGQRLQNIPQVGQNMQKALQQIGVRLPGLSQ